jgi:hypothetical protein
MASCKIDLDLVLSTCTRAGMDRQMSCASRLNCKPALVADSVALLTSVVDLVASSSGDFPVASASTALIGLGLSVSKSLMSSVAASPTVLALASYN